MDPIAIANNMRFLFYGYSAAMIILLGFVILLVRRSRKIDQELTRLKSLVDSK